MATLKAHGECLGKITCVGYQKAYMSDGTILKNIGFGWKLHAVLRPGVDPKLYYEGKVVSHTNFLRERPAYRRFLNALTKATSISNRWIVVTAINAMPSDPDGVYSTIQDEGVDLDFEEVDNLRKLFNAAEYERSLLK